MYVVKTQKALKYLLNKEIDRGRLLDVTRVRRRIGKTTLLIEIARDLNSDGHRALIVQPNKSLADLFNREYNTDIFVSISEVKSKELFISSYLLIDEGLSNVQVKSLRSNFKYNIVGGYNLTY